MRRKPYVYEAEEFFDLGDAGEHPITFTSLVSIEYEVGANRGSVSILKAEVSIDLGGQTQKLDVTSKIKESPYMRKNGRARFLRTILAGWRRCRE
ncbi:MAG: hypothetical protein HC834_04560 [Rhodospirillales bacterium]|nr:hypothetical protein [Rhodospirillales bacterium]